MPDYNSCSPVANKTLNPDGSVSTFGGSGILPADAGRARQYKDAAAIANKLLNPDGSVTATLAGVPAWGGITGDMAEQTDLDAALSAKANIYTRQAQGITAGNNIQGMRVRVTAPPAYTSDWSFLTADGQSFVRTDNDFSYFDGQGGEVKIVGDGAVLIDDYVIAAPFLISAIAGSFSNPEFFWRYFDVEDIDQRIGYV